MPLPGSPSSRDNGVLIVGCDMHYGRAVGERLRSEGYDVCGVAYGDFDGPFPAFTVAGDMASLPQALQQRQPGFRPQRAVVIPRAGPLAPVSEVLADDFIGLADDTLVGAEIVARWLLATRGADQRIRLVLLSAWAAFGIPHASTAAAAMGGLLGLARSWAVEFGASGTVNVVIAGPGAEGSAWDTARPAIGRHPTDAEIAHAVAFFIDERSSGISGQVLSVCGGLTPGMMPA